MSIAVFDSSAVLAIVFDEPGADRAIAMLEGGLSLGDRACLALAAGDRIAVTADRAWARLGLARRIETIR